MADRPSIVYKYESFNIYSILNLKAQSLYFGSPRGFNDPYDCAINATASEPSIDQIETLKEHYVNNHLSPQEVKQRFESLPLFMLKQVLMNGANKGINEVRENFLNTKGVTCFSECNDDLIMWAHYGGQYKGFW